MSLSRFPISDNGFRKLEKELLELKEIERPKIIKAIAEARAHGDLSENAEYLAAKERQGFIEAKISELEDKIARAEIIDISKMDSNQVKYGAKVKLFDEDHNEQVEYKIVSDYEANIVEGLLSLSSPLAKALLNKRIGDYVEFSTPKKNRHYKILSIEYH